MKLDKDTILNYIFCVSIDTGQAGFVLKTEHDAQTALSRSLLGTRKRRFFIEQLEQRFAAEDTALDPIGKEDWMGKDKSEEIRDMLKGVPPKNVIIQVDDLPPKTLAQHMEQQKAQTKQHTKRRRKSR